MDVVCPHCKTMLEADIRNVGQKATCQNCGGTFIINDVPTRIDLGFAHSNVRRVRCLKKWEWIKRYAKYCFWGMGAIALLATIIVLWGNHEPSDRYILAKGDNGVVYRTDRKTGETMMIRGTVMRPVGEYVSSVTKPKETRLLTREELDKVTGRGGRFSEGYFSAKLYNGNSNIRLTKIKFGLTHTDSNGRRFTREYNDILSAGGGDPLSSFNVSFHFVRADEPKDYTYPWTILGAEGEIVK